LCSTARRAVGVLTRSVGWATPRDPGGSIRPGVMSSDRRLVVPASVVATVPRTGVAVGARPGVKGIRPNPLR
jgi:hypothetical protein